MAGRKAYVLTGERFGKLVAKDSPKVGYWRCVCDCGNEKVIRTGNLTSAGVESCGCNTIRSAKSKKNISRLKKANTRAGRRKCRRCKEVWNRPKGDSSKICPSCQTKCHRCNTALTENNRTPGKIKYICKVCTAERVRMGSSPAKQRDYDLARNYGITVFEYEEMLESQNGACYICQREPTGKRLSVDHEHQLKDRQLPGFKKRDKVRGLLCWHCNAAIGKFNDNPEHMRRAAQYLEEPPAQKTLGKTKGSKDE